MDYKTRIDIYNQINKKIKENTDCEKNNLIPIAKGGYGTIYKKKIKYNDNKDNKDIYVAIKELEIEKYAFKHKFNYKIKPWRELILLEKCTKLVLNKKTQNFPILYDFKICDNELNKTILFYSELADGDFLKWCNKPHTVDEWESFLFQLWVGVYTMQKHLKLVHNDLRLPNLLYHKIKPDDKIYFKYIIDGEEYYVPNTGYVFVIWDFGSGELLDFEKDDFKKKIINQKINFSTDLHFFHDLYKRLQMLIIYNKYRTDELEKFFTSEIDLNYLKKTKEDAERRFRKTNRFDEKYKIGLIYHLIETNRYDELYNNKKDNLDESNIIYPPPNDINNILKELSEKYNYSYEDIVLRHNKNIKQKIPSIKFLIKKYFNKYTKKQNYNIVFDV